MNTVTIAGIDKPTSYVVPVNASGTVIDNSAASTSIDAGITDLNTSNDAIAAAIGTPTDAAWDGVAASATVISLLKAIANNTEPA